MKICYNILAWKCRRFETGDNRCSAFKTAAVPKPNIIVPVVELDTIKASDAFGPGSSPGGHTIFVIEQHGKPLKNVMFFKGFVRVMQSVQL